MNYIATGTAYGILYAALGAVALIAIIWPTLIRKSAQIKIGEEFVSARGTQKWWGITASFFSSAMGAWVITAPADIGAAYGAWGVIGYATATGVPWAFLAIFGPKLREITQGRGFTQTDFVRRRLGLVLHVFYTLLVAGTLFVALVVEAITIGAIYSTISPDIKLPVVILSVGVCVLIYTLVSGILATLLTDRMQFLVLSVLIIVGFSCIMGAALPKLDRTVLAEVGRFRVEGLVTLFTLNVSCWFPTFLDPSSWSRMYAAKSTRDARVGLLVAAGLLLIPMTFFGVSGIFGATAVLEGIAEEGDSVFFSLLSVVDSKWSVVLLILATCLSVSTIDTFNTGFSSIMASEIGHIRNINFNWCRLGSFIIFVLAMITALRNPPSVMTLFMIANLMASCATPGMLMSLWPITTPIGVGAGLICAAISVCACGWVRSKTFKGGFDWWLLPEGSTDLPALVTFLIAGGTSTATTLLVSQLEFALRPGSREKQILALEKLVPPAAATANSKGDSELSDYDVLTI